MEEGGRRKGGAMEEGSVCLSLPVDRRKIFSTVEMLGRECLILRI